MDERRADALAGCLLGTALGDSLGLPWEGLSAPKIARKLGEGRLEQRFLFGRGMVSDDTEHAVLTAQAILRSGGDPICFQKSLAWGLRGWFASLPAGIGLATLKACLKLWVGVPPDNSGVRSAGNGPAMRAAILGAHLAEDPEKLGAFVRHSSVLTHTDERAIEAAVLAAEAARIAVLGLSSDAFFERIRDLQAVRDAMIKAEDSLAKGHTVREFADQLGCKDRVTGYSLTSVPVAVYAWLAHRGEFERPVEEVIRLGGDTDTVAAIAGGICGAEIGASHLPAYWLQGLWEWPRSEAWMRKLASELATNGQPVSLAWPLIPLRNALFTVTVLYHGIRRLI